MDKIINGIKFLWSIWTEIRGLKLRTKITLLIIMFGIATGVFYGCSVVDKAYIISNYKHSQRAIPDHIEYIQNDKKITKLDKKVRIKSLQEWKKDIEIKYKEEVINE